ncbi:lyase family protein [Marinilabilia rubra]|uniref:Aspartate ammonia-lyase n=1 Tax=Marinilabilia rubra TaxID=2162893 RepID=A0A2U2BDV0_9BACT|nr:lyase family protein [Marinilabilia rubra]PWE01207.1 aspartate ammonia-lyase [Marinilabilia rubra]
MRTEKDFLGEIEIHDDKLYGIHSVRAQANFPAKSHFPIEWYSAIGLVKKAYYRTYRNFRDTARQKQLNGPTGHQWMSDQQVNSLEEAAEEISSGRYFNHFIVPGIQGGAGTSINMNINEIIANTALKKSGHNPGEYEITDPLDHANIFQSTNDVVPTALHLSLMQQSHKLETSINKLRFSLEELETQHRNILRQGYTQMQKAVPSSYGHLFSSYSDALSRDWWRVSRIRERLKEVNLGGGAAGTGMGIPRYFILNAIAELRKLTNLPLSHSENLADTTMNQDSLVEVHAILKAHAVNLEKISNDLRLIGSDISRHQSLKIPQKQMGSSIMPGKVNPVIVEYVVSVSHKVYANDQMISGLAGQGCLDLNAYLPSIGVAMLESFNLLESACRSLHQNMLKDLQIDAEDEQKDLFKSASITTALVPYIGHKEAEKIALEMKDAQESIFEVNDRLKVLSDKLLREILKPSSLISKGFSLNDLPENQKHP